MPVHDWTRVKAGTFHHFHQTWITHLAGDLNRGLLPADYYAMAEQRAWSIFPDVLTLRAPSPPDRDDGGPSGGAVSVAQAPPKASLVMTPDEHKIQRLRQNRLVIRHVSRHQVIAIAEIVSPANKDREESVADFVEKSVEILDREIHLLIVDLFPPGRHDPAGIHGAIWSRFSAEEYESPPDKPLLAVGYQAGGLPTAYLEPLGVGDPLPTVPLFLTPRRYVNVPLAPSYDAAWADVPGFWRAVIEGREPRPDSAPGDL